MAKVRTYIDPFGNTMNLWWGDHKSAYSSEEVDSPNRNDVILKDKQGRPISVEIIGFLPSELNLFKQFKNLVKDKKDPFILSAD